MLPSKKYRQYFILGCLILGVIVKPTVGRTGTSTHVQQSVQMAQNVTSDNPADLAQIRKVILLNEQKYHWRPQVDILAIADGYALASVHDQNTGGESVLKKELGDWKVICGTGGAFGFANTLAQHCKIPIDTASNLIKIKSNTSRR